jgi:hypothetical protein
MLVSQDSPKLRRIIPKMVFVQVNPRLLPLMKRYA